MEDDGLIQNKDEVTEELRRLGFSNAQAILQTVGVSGIYGNDIGPALECNDFTSNPENIEYSFWLIRDKSDAGWHLKAIWAYVDMPSSISVDVGSVIIGSAYDIGDGPLPTRDQIRADFAGKVKVQEEKETEALQKAHKMHVAILNRPESLEKGRKNSKTQNP